MTTKEVTVTYEQIAQFRGIAELYLRSADKETNLYHCVDKMFKKLKKRHERYIDKQNTARRAHALTDPKTKKLLMTAGSYDYTADGLNKLETDLRALQYKKISFNTEMLDEGEVPDDLKFEFQSANGAIGVCSDYEVRNAFAGIVMPAAESEEEDEGEEESD